MKKVILFGIFVLIIISSFVAASDFERYALQYYTGNDESYNLRTSGINGVNYNNLSVCSVGYGSTMGTYPVAFRYAPTNNTYYYLVVPTSSSIRIINSNCTEINSITISNIAFYGTMSTIVQPDSTHKYVLLGYNSSSSMYGFYAITFNPVTQLLEFDAKKDIGSDINTNTFNGVACGWVNESLSNGGCGITKGTTLIYWDIEADLITNYTAAYSLSRTSNRYMPYGSVVDYDNDNVNEMVFVGKEYHISTQYQIQYSVFDMNSRTFDKQLMFKPYADYSIYAGIAGNDDMDVKLNALLGTPCQIGGYASDFEMCFQLSGDNVGTPYNSMVIQKYDNSVLSYDINGNHSFSFSTGNYNNSVNKNYVSFVNHNSSHNQLSVYSSDYATQLNMFYIPVSASSTNDQINIFLMDMDGDGIEEVIFNNGEIYGLNGTLLNYSLPNLLSTSTGYLVAGELNGDYENEIIYSDASNIYIYSTNPIENYTFYAEGYGVCEDTDGGKNYTVFGITYNDDVTLWDTCSFIHPVKLNEMYCLGNSPVYEQVNCTALGYYSCLVGKCLNETDYDFYEEGIANGTINATDGSVIIPIVRDPYQAGQLPEVIDSIQNNIQLIFALFFIVSLVVLTAHKSRNPIVLIFVGIIGTVIMSIIGFIPSSVLVIIIVSLVLLMLLGLTLLKSKDG